MVQWSTQDYVYVTAECVIGVLSLVGNILVLLAIARTRSLRTVTNCFIGSLAAADVLVGLVLPPSVILPYLGLPHDFYGCVLINTVVVLITNISILSLLTVALERYLAISDPFRYHRIMSIRTALLVVGLTWVVAILIGLIPMMGWNLGDEGFEMCSFTGVISMEYMVYLIFFGVTLVPLIFMMLIYCYIFHIVRKQQRAVAQLSVTSSEGRQNERKQRREIRGAKGLAYVIVLFAACWMPIHIMNSITLFAPQHEASYEWLLVAIVLSHANSFINPFLYAFGNSKFKIAMMRLLLCGRCKRLIPAGASNAEMDSKFHTPLPSTVPKKMSHDWSSNDVLSRPSNPGRVKFNTQTGVSFTNASGILNEGFCAEEQHTADLEDESAEQTESAQTDRDSGHAEITVNKTANNSCSLFSSDSSHYIANKQIHVLVANAGDSGVCPVQNGRSDQLWMTHSSVSDYSHNHSSCPSRLTTMSRSLSEDSEKAEAFRHPPHSTAWCDPPPSPSCKKAASNPPTEDENGKDKHSSMTSSWSFSIRL